MSSNSVIAREFPTGYHYPGSEQGRNEYMIREGETGSGFRTSNPSNSTSHGMASFAVALRNSSYLEPTQQLLDEVVCVSNAVEPGLDEQMRRIRSVGMTLWNGERSLQHGGNINHHEGTAHSTSHHTLEKHDVRNRITKLVALLDELENRYEQYLRHMYGVVSSFEVVAGLGAATPYTALTIQAMSKHFSNLRDAIITQIHSSREALPADPQRIRQKAGAFQPHSTIQERPAWRLIRGLPENSVAALRAWLFEHFLHPYPNENEKLMLASQTGLTRNQISNWFINARVRLWKPMIEEMYKEEFAEDSQDSNPSA